MKPHVSIIIVSHDHRNYLYGCISSVLKQKKVAFEIIVINNASQDDTAGYMLRNFPKIQMVTNTKREGLSKNINTGIRISTGKYVLVLNPDASMQKGSLNFLVRRMNSDKRIGICGPQLLNPDGSVQYSFRKFPTWKTAVLRRTPLRYIFLKSHTVVNHLNVYTNHQLPQEVDWMLGACLLIRRDMLNSIGLFDEGYGLYVEDIDICLRAHLAGWKVWHEPKAKVLHEHAAKSDRS
jgi:N-acetylglucosaminyl-diphospho-decaprenol L-rhamnosyltransferase